MARSQRGSYVAGKATRVKLIEAAEELFALRGVDAVSLNEVRIAAGQSNTAAVNYHFGSKAELLKAIFEHRLARIEAERLALLDALDEATGGAEPRRALAALLEPLAGSVDRGEHYVGLLVQLLNGEHGSYSEHLSLLADPSLSPSGQRVHALLRESIRSLPAPVTERRLSFVYTSAMQALARHRRQQVAGTAPATEVVVADLIELLAAALLAPVPSGGGA